MSGNSQTARLWPIAFWLALLAGICTAWSPRYWAVSVAITLISMVAASWSALAGSQPFADFARSPLAWLVALIGSWGFLQLALHISVLQSQTMYDAVVWAVSAISFILGALILRDRTSRALFLHLLLWSVTALAFIAIVQSYGRPVKVFGIFEGLDSVFGTFISRNQFVALMEIAAPIALWFMLERNLMAGGLCYVVIIAAAITAASRSGFILLCVELVVFIAIVLLARRRQSKSVLLILAGFVLLVVVTAAIADTEQLRKRFTDNDPFAVRRELTVATTKLIAERPWMGHGMGTWLAIYPHVATFDVALIANEAHNDWAQWAAEGGVPFAFLIAVLVVSVARKALRSVWGLGLLSVMAHSYVDFPLREPVLSFLWFALAGALTQSARIGSEDKKPSASGL